jgi:hypothetical protein
MLKKKYLLFGFTVFLASSIHRGVVAMKVSDSVAHVGLQQSEATVGDHVQLYTNRCNRIKGEEQTCRKISKGHGRIISIISADYVSVEFDQGITFQEGDFIEKHSH